MVTPAVIGLTGRLSSSIYSSGFNDKLFSAHDIGVAQFSATLGKTAITAKNSIHFDPGFPSERSPQSVKALKEHVDTSSAASSETWLEKANFLEQNEDDFESSLKDLVLLQKSMLEKQWNLPCERKGIFDAAFGDENKIKVIRSGASARHRRSCLRRALNHMSSTQPSKRNDLRSIISWELLQGHPKGYVKGIASRKLLSHDDVVHLSKKIKAGLSLDEHRSRVKMRLGYEPSDEELASSLRMTRAELQSKMMECSLAREKLTMSNVRLVMSIAQKYDNMGAEMADLVQGGLIGLLRGIDKFDSSKGFKISTYLYWWIRQGVSRALIDNSRTLRLPGHLHNRLYLIRNAKLRLEEKGITPSPDKIAELLKMSKKKIRNATEAVSQVFSLDRDAFASLSGLPGETLHSYVADNKLENNPWHVVDAWFLKDEVNNLIDAALGERERDIMRLYYGLDTENHTWEDISKQFGLSRERVRQVGLVALEKLKHAARKRGLEAMLVKH